MSESKQFMYYAAWVSDMSAGWAKKLLSELGWDIAWDCQESETDAQLVGRLETVYQQSAPGWGRKHVNTMPPHRRELPGFSVGAPFTVKADSDEPGIFVYGIYTSNTNPCAEIGVDEDIFIPKRTKIPFESVTPPVFADRGRFPHACPRCGSPAYVGLNDVDCSRRCG